MTRAASPASGSDRTTFTRHGIRRGFIAAQPLAIGILVYGVTFGLLALGSRLSVGDALLMSVSVYSATAQVAAISALSHGAGVLVGVTTVVLLNARYLLYGATLRPWLGAAAPLASYGSLYVLGDGNWLLSMRAHEAGEDDAGYILGSGLATFLPWLAGTLLGGVVGHWIPGPRTLGLDFLLVAFCAAMLVGMLRAHAAVLPALAAFAAAAAADRWAPPGWAVIAAGIAGAAVAGWRHREAPA
ncbi:MAG: AzlC family ABC transporter permease, partial [Pseudomonadota bacterium]|nr:AzlC family ABC transporter permease [Pseudomonadota bacterium]